MASNSWVVSGNHTASGKPLLASDAHLGTGVPSFWTIQHLNFTHNGEQKTLVGSSTPGIPMIFNGRSNDIAWALSASLTDVSDLYREEAN